MKYRLISAWKVWGGISLPSGTTTVKLFEKGEYQVTVTSDPRPFLFELERKAVLGKYIVKGLHTGKAEPNVLSSLNEELVKLKVPAPISPHQTYLLIEANDDVNISLSNRVYDDSDFIATLQEIDEEAIIQKHIDAIRAAKLSVALESIDDIRFEKVATGIYLKTPEGRIVYDFNLKGSIETFISRPIDSKMTNRIAERYDRIKGSGDLENVQRLYTQMLDRESDKLRAFLAGWNALEILIAKVFKEYEDHFFAPLASGKNPTSRERFLDRLKDVMKSKYRLTDKFLVITAALLPPEPDTKESDDYQIFQKVKSVRDDISHGKDVPEMSLPTKELSLLFKRCMRAYLEAKANSNA